MQNHNGFNNTGGSGRGRPCGSRARGSRSNGHASGSRPFASSGIGAWMNRPSASAGGRGRGQAPRSVRPAGSIPRLGAASGPVASNVTGPATSISLGSGVVYREAQSVSLAEPNTANYPRGAADTVQVLLTHLGDRGTLVQGLGTSLPIPLNEITINIPERMLNDFDKQKSEAKQAGVKYHIYLNCHRAIINFSRAT